MVSSTTPQHPCTFQGLRFRGEGGVVRSCPATASDGMYTRRACGIDNGLIESQEMEMMGPSRIQHES